jgi:hypothetical protein
MSGYPFPVVSTLLIMTIIPRGVGSAAIRAVFSKAFSFIAPNSPTGLLKK